jgi:hypothetical protein
MSTPLHTIQIVTSSRVTIRIDFCSCLVIQNKQQVERTRAF